MSPAGVAIKHSQWSDARIVRRSDRFLCWLSCCALGGRRDGAAVPHGGGTRRRPGTRVAGVPNIVNYPDNFGAPRIPHIGYQSLVSCLFILPPLLKAPLHPFSKSGGACLHRWTPRSQSRLTHLQRVQRFQRVSAVSWNSSMTPNSSPRRKNLLGQQRCLPLPCRPRRSPAKGDIGTYIHWFVDFQYRVPTLPTLRPASLSFAFSSQRSGHI